MPRRSSAGAKAGPAAGGGRHAGPCHAVAPKERRRVARPKVALRKVGDKGGIEDGPSLLRTFGFALRRGWRRVTGKSNSYVRRLYRNRDYLDAYAEHTDIRVRRDPHAAVGGYWYTHGPLQLDFLVRHGLRPHHRLLDIGCGTFRAGRHFARYLETGRYTGLDISPAALAYAERVIASDGLGAKRPRLVLSREKRLRFESVRGEKFDYLIAYSVFTHLEDAHVEECFRHLTRVMHERTIFFFTFNAAPEYARACLKDFRFPFAYFQSLANCYGFELRECTADFADPTGQRMVKLTRLP